MRTSSLIIQSFEKWGYLYLPIVLVLLTTCPALGQYDDLNTFGNNSTVSAFDQAFKQGIDALIQGNTGQALQSFEAAKNDASRSKDKDAKNKARSAEKRVNTLYIPYFAMIDEASVLEGNRDFKSAQEKLESARTLYGKYAADVGTAFHQLDQQLSAQLDQQLSRVEQQRLEAFNNRCQAGEQRMYGRDYAGALKEMETARSLLFEEKEGGTLVTDIIEYKLGFGIFGFASGFFVHRELYQIGSKLHQQALE